MTNPQDQMHIEETPDWSNYAQVIPLMMREIEQLRAQVTQQQSPASAAKQLKPVKPDTYDGKRTNNAVDAWLYSINLYFDFYETSDSTRVSYAATLLRGPAQLWWRMMGTPITTWDVFETSIRAQFSPINAIKAARDKISALRQTRSVQAYANDFQALLLQIPDMGSADQLDRFIRGLKNDIRIEVELREPKTLAEAIRIADRFDTITFNAQVLRQNHRQDAIRPRQPYDGPAPMDIGSMQTPRYSRLTAEDKSRLRTEGRCFYCKEKNHVAAVCPKKKTNRRQENKIEQGKGVSH